MEHRELIGLLLAASFIAIGGLIALSIYTFSAIRRLNKDREHQHGINAMNRELSETLIKAIEKANESIKILAR
jgi:hypothetical protein